MYLYRIAHNAGIVMHNLSLTLARHNNNNYNNNFKNLSALTQIFIFPRFAVFYDLLPKHYLLNKIVT